MLYLTACRGSPSTGLTHVRKEMERRGAVLSVREQGGTVPLTISPGLTADLPIPARAPENGSSPSAEPFSLSPDTPFYGKKFLVQTENTCYEVFLAALNDHFRGVSAKRGQYGSVSRPVDRPGVLGLTPRGGFFAPFADSLPEPSPSLLRRFYCPSGDRTVAKEKRNQAGQ
jgi:hypothetical protein